MSIVRLAGSFLEAISAQGVFTYLGLSKYLMKGAISAAMATPVPQYHMPILEIALNGAVKRDS